MNELELKTQAFRERLAAIVVDYEDKNADLRVTCTQLDMENTALKQQVAELLAEKDTDVSEETPTDS